jgi:hypothetical protein
MKRHVDLLAWLYFTWGAIFALVAVAGAALSAGAVAIATTTGAVGFTSETAAQVTAFTMALLAGLAAVWAVLHLWIGRALGRYVPRSRLLALGLAVVNLVLLPFGTALGGYALWVLLKDEGRRLFEGAGDRRSPPASMDRI